MASVSPKARGRRWEVIFWLLMAGAAIFFLVEEFRFGARASHTTATIKAWKSEGLLGYRGVAEAKVHWKGTERDHRVQTSLWRRLSPGDQVPVVVDMMTSEHAHIDSFWQRFAPQTFVLVAALGYLVAIWGPWRKKSGGRDASTPALQGPASAEGGPKKGIASRTSRCRQTGAALRFFGVHCFLSGPGC